MGRVFEGNTSLKLKVHGHNGDIWLSGCLDLGQIGSIRMGMVFEREASLKGRQCLSAAGGRER